MKPRPLEDWFFVEFDAERISVHAEPPGRDPFEFEVLWNRIERVFFVAEGPYTSDGIYLSTPDREETYPIPVEARGGLDLWTEILRRNLFDAELAGEANGSLGGTFVWPPVDS